jgi:hypothetical protein
VIALRSFLGAIFEGFKELVESLFEKLYTFGRESGGNYPPWNTGAG